MNSDEFNELTFHLSICISMSAFCFMYSSSNWLNFVTASWSFSWRKNWIKNVYLIWLLIRLLTGISAVQDVLRSQWIFIELLHFAREPRVCRSDYTDLISNPEQLVGFSSSFLHWGLKGFEYGQMHVNGRQWGWDSDLCWPKPQTSPTQVARHGKQRKQDLTE